MFYHQRARLCLTGGFASWSGFCAARSLPELGPVGLYTTRPSRPGVRALCPRLPKALGVDTFTSQAVLEKSFKAQKHILVSWKCLHLYVLLKTWLQVTTLTFFQNKRQMRFNVTWGSNYLQAPALIHPFITKCWPFQKKSRKENLRGQQRLRCAGRWPQMAEFVFLTTGRSFCLTVCQCHSVSATAPVPQ